jgi:hypothetical protein
MNTNESVRVLVKEALLTKKQTRAWLSEKLGQHKSWATRFFNGEIKSLTDEQVETLERALDIRFFAMGKPGQHSPAALDFATEFDRNQALASVATALRIAMANVVFSPRYIATAEAESVGGEILRLAKLNEDKPVRLTKAVLELLT